MNDSKSRAEAPVTARYTQHSAEELDLVDIGVMMWRRRRLMSLVFSICLILTLVVTLVDAPTYTYTTSVQLGSILSPTTGEVTALMSAQNVAKSMNDVYIPRATYKFLAERGATAGTIRLPRIEADGDRDGTHVVIGCVSTEEKASQCTTVEKFAADEFIEDNTQFVTAQNNALLGLRSRAAVLHVQLDKLDASAAIYSKQVADLENQIERIKKNSVNAARETTNGTSALSNLILDTQAQQALENLTTARQQLEVTIPQARAQITGDLDDNAREQQLREQQLSQSVIQVQDMGLRSLRPTGFGHAAALALGMALSLLLAIIAVFLGDYVEQIRERVAAQTKR